MNVSESTWACKTISAFVHFQNALNSLDFDFEDFPMHSSSLTSVMTHVCTSAVCVGM